MFNKLHLFDIDAPGGDEDFRGGVRSYLRMAGTVPKGPADFSWSERQLTDLEELWLEPDTEGARDRLAADLGRFVDRLGWSVNPTLLEDAEQHGDEYLLTVSSAAAELYSLPWEVLQVGASGTYLTDFSGTLVRYAVPGLTARTPLEVPPKPGVLFAWSAAGGAVPHEEQGKTIRAAAEAGNVAFEELAEVDGASLQAALDNGPPSVLHLLCHGLPGPEGEPPRLRWGGDRAQEITATRLARMLRPYKNTIRLVVLSACGSGDGAHDPLFMSSLAQELHKKGIPNVVASRYPLSVRGSQVLVRSLYDKLLREAWSLERALSHTRGVLFRPDNEGRVYAGDAYGIQLYASDSETFISANGVEAERPVLASYPFGDADQPVPARKPPRKRVTVELAGDLEKEHSRKRLKALLVRLSEDVSIRHILKPVPKGTKVLVDTTVDGAQRLLANWRCGDLAQALGVMVISVTVASELMPAAANSGDAQNSGSMEVLAFQRVASVTRPRTLLVGLSAAVFIGAAAIAIAGVLNLSPSPAGSNAGAAVEAVPPVVSAAHHGVVDPNALPEGAVEAAPASLGDADEGGPLAASELPEPAAPELDSVDGDGDGAEPAAPELDSVDGNGDSGDGDSAEPPAEPPAAAASEQDTPETAPAEAAPAPARKAPTAAKRPKKRVRAAKSMARQTVAVVGERYNRKTRRVTISWRPPDGAAGVLVVTNKDNWVRGVPTAGKAYRDGSWPRGGAAKVFSAKTSSHSWLVQPGETVWFTFWAFDANNRYSIGTSIEYKADAK